LRTVSSESATENATERRAARRFAIALPLLVRSDGPAGASEQTEQTRDVSFRGVYFTTEQKYEAGERVECVLTLPKEMTLAGDVKIRCFGEVVRVESHVERHGVAARIERYEFLAAP
jgi:hypothetical protein